MNGVSYEHPYHTQGAREDRAKTAKAHGETNGLLRRIAEALERAVGHLDEYVEWLSEQEKEA